MEAVYGVLLPFAGTALGAACVFGMRQGLSDGIQRGLTGFAAGVMTAASVWSLLIPAIDRSAGMGIWSFVPAAAGFWLGSCSCWRWTTSSPTSTGAAASRRGLSAG